MDNQHKKIKSYRDLSQEEIDLMNEIKECETQVAELYHKVMHTSGTDGRFANVARTDLQKGFMMLVRAVAQPQTNWEVSNAD